MKTFFYSFLCCLSFGLFTACSEEENGSEAADFGSRTVLVYMAADNNLVGFAHDDLDEMKLGMLNVSGSDVHFLVYMDFGNTTRLVELKNHKGRVEEVLVKEYDRPRNSVGVQETAEVFRDAFQAFPAQSYGLVYWSHGEGWLPQGVKTRWIGQDAGNGFMNIADFVTALQSAPHLDFLLFDACFMQGLEVAYELREFTDYLVGSPTETPAPGAPYQKIVPAMFAAQLPSVRVAEAYYEYYAGYYVDPARIPASEQHYLPWNKQGHWISGLSMAVLKTELLASLARHTQQAVSNIQAVSSDQLRARVFDYDQRRYSHCGYYDVSEMMKALLPAKDFAAWQALYREACVFWKTTPYNYSGDGGLFEMTNAHGVSHYIPLGTAVGALDAYRQTSWYQAAGLSQLGW